jgi:ABC-type hemin transport system substrate-binding protein
MLIELSKQKTNEYINKFNDFIIHHFAINLLTIKNMSFDDFSENIRQVNAKLNTPEGQQLVEDLSNILKTMASNIVGPIVAGTIDELSKHMGDLAIEGNRALLNISNEIPIVGAIISFARTINNVSNIIEIMTKITQSLLENGNKLQHQIRENIDENRNQYQKLKDNAQNLFDIKHVGGIRKIINNELSNREIIHKRLSQSIQFF